MNAGLVLDIVLVLVLLWVAWAALWSRDLFRGIVLFIAFGMVLSIVWIRLGAPDVGLAEAAIGAGLTGALLLATWGALPAGSGTPDGLDEPEDAPPDDEVAGDLPTPGAIRPDHGRTLLVRSVLAPALAIVTAGVVIALVTPPVAPGLGRAIGAVLPQSAAANPVTAVLLDFRGYDTLLEMAVLTAALAGVWSLGRAHRTRPTEPSPVLIGLTRVLAPLFPLICGYLLWVGAEGPGGAFQAGAVLATAAVLYVLSERRPGPRLPEQPLRAGAVAGLGVFLAVALGVMFAGGAFLEYPPELGGALILLIEAAAAVAIALILAGLFIGGRPGGADG